MKINLLFLLVVVIMVGCSQSSNIPNSPPFENETEYSSYDLLKSEIESMLQREGISPDIYDQIEMKIRVLESEGIDTKELDQLLAQLSVGGRKENITRLETTKTTYDLLKSDLESLVEAEGIHPQLYEDLQKKVDQLAAQGVNTDELRLLLARLPVGGKEEIKTQPIQQTGPTIWHNMEEGTWEPRGNPPPCPDPFVLQSPVDLSLVSSILYPGQVRGGDFKPHGGFSTEGKTQVTSPIEGYIWNAARFYDEFGLHYMFDIQHPCGMMVRLGHLGEVPPNIEAIFNDFPAPKTGDSRTTLIDPFFVKAGEVIATNTQQGSGFDFGFYDLRKENEAAQDPIFREEHKDEISQAYYALCWFDYLSEEDEKIVRGLPATDGKSGKSSAYCK